MSVAASISASSSVVMRPFDVVPGFLHVDGKARRIGRAAQTILVHQHAPAGHGNLQRPRGERQI